MAAKLDPRQLGHTIHQLVDLRAKLFLQVLSGQGRILQDIVQEPGSDGDGIHVPLRQQQGGLVTVLEVRFARFAELSVVGLLGGAVGSPEELLHILPALLLQVHVGHDGPELGREPAAAGQDLLDGIHHHQKGVSSPANSRSSLKDAFSNLV